MLKIITMNKIYKTLIAIQFTLKSIIYLQTQKQTKRNIAIQLK